MFVKREECRVGVCRMWKEGGGVRTRQGGEMRRDDEEEEEKEERWDRQRNEKRKEGKKRQRNGQFVCVICMYLSQSFFTF